MHGGVRGRGQSRDEICTGGAATLGEGLAPAPSPYGVERSHFQTRCIVHYLVVSVESRGGANGAFLFPMSQTRSRQGRRW